MKELTKKDLVDLVVKYESALQQIAIEIGQSRETMQHIAQKALRGDR